MQIKTELSNTDQAILQFAIEVALHITEQGMAEVDADGFSLKVLRLTKLRLMYMQRRLQFEGLAVYGLEDVVGLAKFKKSN